MRVAVLIPCFNEEAGIAKVASDFRRALPNAAIFVYDNNSTDRTAERAAAAGAKVRQHRVQGKGQVVRRMFADVEAEIHVLVDGDDTYDAAAAPKLIELLVSEQLDLVSAARISANKRAIDLAIVLAIEPFRAWYGLYLAGNSMIFSPATKYCHGVS